MRSPFAVLLALLACCRLRDASVRAFVTPGHRGSRHGVHAPAPAAVTITTTTTARRAFVGMDPSSLMDALSTFNLADAVDGISADAVSASADAAGAAAAAADAAASNPGWFGFLTGPIEGLLQVIHSALVAVGVSADAWGVSIIMMTVIIKVLTFPLTKTQLESTNKMQAIQPAVKDLQAKYQSNPEVMNQRVAELYQQNEINPLAGCLPSFVQIPVFIGLYRAVLNLAKDNKLDEPFLWLPNLEGPTYGADPTHGSDWILQNWVNGAPSLGWQDTIAFLSLPLFLVVSQFVSMQLMQPKSDDPAQQQSNLILKLLPLMIGWFSLNVPAALCIYWVTNNIITTATSLIIKNTMKVEPVTLAGGSAAASRAPEPPSIFAPPREKPAGFGSTSTSSSSSSTSAAPTKAVDAEIVAPKAEVAKKVVETVEPVVEEIPVDEVTYSEEVEAGDESKPKKSGKSRRKKRKN